MLGGFGGKRFVRGGVCGGGGVSQKARPGVSRNGSNLFTKPPASRRKTAANTKMTHSARSEGSFFFVSAVVNEQ